MGKVIEVSFPGGKQVSARVHDFEILTDQSKKNGGKALFPEPFHMFLSSIATCAGIYALEFCHTRELTTQGLALAMEYGWDREKKMIENVNIKITLPKDFPSKYTGAIIRSVDLCAVKRHIKEEIAITITTQCY